MGLWEVEVGDLSTEVGNTGLDMETFSKYRVSIKT